MYFTFNFDILIDLIFLGRLIEHEDKEVGAVSASTYINFLRHAGGKWSIIYSFR